MITDVLPRTPQDVARLRRELIAWNAAGGRGEAAYLEAILLGRQPVKPPGRPDVVAAVLAECERQRLEAADLWFVDADLCDVVQVAYPSMPAFAPQPQDLPSQAGFVIFEKPVGLLTQEEIGFDSEWALGDPLLAQVLACGSRVVAASWSPLTVPGMPVRGPAGAAWLTFYGETNLNRMEVPAGPDRDRLLLAQRLSPRPEMTPEDEIAFAWCPPGLTPEQQQRYVIPTDRVSSVGKWASMLFAMFQIARQQNLTQTDAETVARPERRRTLKAGLRAPGDIRVVRMRQRKPAETAAAAPRAGKTFQHRWVIRGHWRNVWYATQQTHRPRWFPQTLAVPAGCEDAPLLGGDKVTRIGTT